MKFKVGDSGPDGQPYDVHHKIGCALNDECLKFVEVKKK